MERRATGIMPPGRPPLLRETGLPPWFPPMLATIARGPFSREGWLFEPKLDGERCLVFRGKKGVELFSRNRKLLNDRYPELAGAFEKQRAQAFIVDGAIVTLEQGVSIAKLQGRYGQHPSDEFRQQIPVWFYAFDLLFLDTYDLRQVPLRYRKSLLLSSIDFHGPLLFTEHRHTEGEAYYQEACQQRWDGVIAKDAAAAYVSEPSRRWLLINCVHGH
jgi:bifunctional non-homologous end joining protein LigD